MSTAVAIEARYTPEDLLAMPDGENFELVDGRLVERKMGYESSWVGSRLLIYLGRHCVEHDLGDVLQSETGYQCFPHDAGLVRKPDVSFVRRGRLPVVRLPKGWARIVPDLAVEVVSPNDSAEEVEEKLADYRKAGVPLIWIIYPEARAARIHRIDGSAGYLLEDGELSGEDVIPGFRCPLREILPRLAPAEGPDAAPNGPNGTGPA
jgi:Uma2 family endonuclease